MKISVNGLTPAQTWQKVRGALRHPAEKHDPTPAAIIEQLRRKHPRLHHAWRLKENLRQLYRVPATDAAEHLRRWIKRVRRSGINAFVTLAKRLRRHRERILTPSTSACRTPCSKASTPVSAASNAARTATPTSTT